MSQQSPAVQYIGLALASASVVGALMFGAVKILGDSDPEQTVAASGPDGTAPGESDEPVGSPSEGSSPSDSTAGSGDTPADTILGQLLIPVSATATNERAAVSKLRCGGSNSFEAIHIIDGDPQTGWGASVGDGAGQSVTIDFGQIVKLSSVGLTPGYLRVAPRGDLDCNDASAFEFNRFIEEVEYQFDDGSTLRQTFERLAEVQTMPVAIRTKTVTITVVSTLKVGDDQDTIISDAEFYGTIE